MDPDVIGAVGHTVRLAAPKVRLDGSHKFGRSFVVEQFKLEVDSRQGILLKVDIPNSAGNHRHFRTSDVVAGFKGCHRYILQRYLHSRLPPPPMQTNRRPPHH